MTAAVDRAPCPLPLRLAALGIIAGTVLLSGCSVIGGITGGVAGIASGTATGNPGVGIAVGISVKAAVDASIKALMRHWTNEDQTYLAETIGAMNVGETRSWHVEHRVPTNSAHGQVTLLRIVETPLTLCKEGLFTVENGQEATTSPGFITTACADANGWRWAVAEPSVNRWGPLQ